MVQEMPADHKGGYALASDEVMVEAEEYPAAVDAVERLVPEGWRIIALRVDRDLKAG